MESNLLNAYKEAYKIACTKLISSDLEKICLNSNAVYNEMEEAIKLCYLGNDYLVSIKNGDVVQVNSNNEVTTTVKVLILHYLLNSQPSPLSNKLISFREIPCGGAIYYETFTKRAIDPLKKVFGLNIDSFLKAAKSLGGELEKFGQASATLKVFPLVPITYVIWQGDDELPATANILLDSSVSKFLPVEDIVLAASFGAYELIRRVKA